MNIEIVEKINKYIQQYYNKNIAIYGTGKHTEEILEQMNKREKIYCLIDKDTMIKSKYGLPVYSIDQVIDKIDVIIISSFEFQYFIYDRIKKYESSIEIIKLYEPKDYFINDEISYNKCQSIWEKDTMKTHRNFDMKAFYKAYQSINSTLNFSNNDIVLDIGCGDGRIDYYLKNVCKKLYGFDFSENKLNKAKKLNVECIYNKNSFLDEYSYKLCNKAFSYGVMQYCKPNDIEKFIVMSINGVSRDGIVAHCDVPDKTKAYIYYKKYYNIPKEIIAKHYEEIYLLFNDGSYWIDMNKVLEICEKNNIQCDIYDELCEYRSRIVIRRL